MTSDDGAATPVPADRIDALLRTQRDLEQLLHERGLETERLRRELEDRTAAWIRVDLELRRMSERLRTLIENIPGAVYRCANDTSWTMEYISDHITRICGYPASDFIGNHRRSYASIIHPDDVFHVISAVNTGVARRKPYLVEYRVRHESGMLRWVQEKGQGMFGPDGTLLWLDGVIFDISDRVPRD